MLHHLTSFAWSSAALPVAEVSREGVAGRPSAFPAQKIPMNLVSKFNLAFVLLFQMRTNRVWRLFSKKPFVFVYKKKAETKLPLNITRSRGVD